MECPICHHEISDAVYEGSVADMLKMFSSKGVMLTKSEARLLCVMKDKNRPVSLSLLLDGLYGQRPDGGPDYADNIITIHMTRIRRKIQKAGLPWKIVNFPGFGYELAEQHTRSTMKSVAGALAIALLLAHPVIGRLF